MPASRLGFGTGLLAAFLAGSPSAVAGPVAQGCSYPTATNVEAIYSGGHTFITWDEIPTPVPANINGEPRAIDETYVVYVSDEPITDVEDATCIMLNGGFFEIPENSSRFYADQVPKYDEQCLWGDCPCEFEKRHTGRLWARRANGDPYKLASGQGVLVLTPCTPGVRYYAVTTIPDGGNEYTCLDSGEGGNVTGAVTEGVDGELEDPEPLLITEEAAECSANSIEVYLQYMDPLDWNVTLDAPNLFNCYYGFDDPIDPSWSNRMTKAIQYAYTYEVAIPSGTMPSSGWPATLVLHGRGGAKADCSEADQGSVLIRPYDAMITNWYGCARSYDYRAADPEGVVYPVSGDEIVNYTEQRAIRALYDTWWLKENSTTQALDPNRFYVRGHSMGGGGTLGMALRYPKVFAAAHASKPPTAFRDLEVHDDCEALGSACPTPPSSQPINMIPFLWGDFSEEDDCLLVSTVSYLPRFLRTEAEPWDDVLESYSGKFSIYQWQDHRGHMQGSGTGTTCTGAPFSEAPFGDRRFDDMVPFGAYHSYDDAIVPYCNHAHPLHPKLNDGLRCAAAEYLDEGGHVNQTVYEEGNPLTPSGLDYSFSFGMPPPLTADESNAPFHGHEAVLGETVPGLRLSAEVTPAPPCDVAAAGTLLRAIDWESSWHELEHTAASGPTESDTDGTRWQMFFDNLANVDITVDITPRRLQLFSPKEEDTYEAEVHYIVDGTSAVELLTSPPDLVVETASDGRLMLIIEGLTLVHDRTYRVRIIEP